MIFSVFIYCECKSQFAGIRKKYTYELIQNEKKLNRIDSFNMSGGIVTSYYYNDHLIISTDDEKKDKANGLLQVIRHYEYDANGVLLKEYNQYPGGRVTSPAFYARTDSLLTAFYNIEGKEKKRTMWTRTLNTYGDTVEFLEYGGPNGELTSGNSVKVIYDRNHRVIDRKKYILKDVLKMHWQPTNYREHFFYSNTSVFPDSVFNYFLDSDSVIFTIVFKYNSGNQLIEKKFTNVEGYIIEKSTIHIVVKASKK